jgi:hypothetical protein
MNSAPPPSDNDFSNTSAFVLPTNYTVDGGNSSHNTVSFSTAIITTDNTGIEVISDDEEDLPPLLIDCEVDDSFSIRDDDWKKRYQQGRERREYYFHQISSPAENSTIRTGFMDGFAGSISVIPRSGRVIDSRATRNLPLAGPVNVYAYGHTQDAIDRIFINLNIN